MFIGTCSQLQDINSANLGICPVNFSTKILAAMNAFERMSEHFQWLTISTDDIFMKLVLVSRMFHNKKLASNMSAMLFVTRFLKTAIKFSSFSP